MSLLENVTLESMLAATHVLPYYPEYYFNYY
jgi:hypothetical protein